MNHSNWRNSTVNDASAINLRTRPAVRYWTMALGVTEDELKRIVDHVGASPDRVREELRGLH